jgi:uncharacterized protein YgbK (DUF1537 family)
MVLKWSQVCHSLPPLPPAQEIDRLWLPAVRGLAEKIIVLDDDPTGVQTVHSIPVYTSWDCGALKAILGDESRLVYILTNSRALTPDQTAAIHSRFGSDLMQIARKEDKTFLLISRSDSTLRGHFPVETQALFEALGGHAAIDGEVIVPCFFEGGRITFKDVHYLREGDDLVPAAETEFAKDPTFGYGSSDLKAWVEEKTAGRYPASGVTSISIEHLRKADLDFLAGQLMAVADFNKVIVNAIDPADLKVFVAALVRAIRNGKRFLFRTAASFVQMIGGISAKPLLTTEALYPEGRSPSPGLVVVGSYVHKTTRQVERLREIPRMAFIEWDVTQASTDHGLSQEAARVTQAVESAFASEMDACVFTTRSYHSDPDGPGSKEKGLLFSARVSEGLHRSLLGIQSRPGFLVAKGGITSSDIGVKTLGVKKAMVLGQIRPGVPVWALGPESRFPGLPYVIFPGNVGDEWTLHRVVEILRGETKRSDQLSVFNNQ